MIFVQIASYRDPELKPTIFDCLEKAKYPDDVRIGLVSQDEGDHQGLRAMADKQMRVEFVDWNKSRGLGWARALTQKMWEGEEFTLQIDSHMRFEQDWDAKLLAMMEQVPSRKPIIGSYCTSYTPGESLMDGVPCVMAVDKFLESGAPIFKPHYMDGWEALTAPVPARFVSGHFFFTLGVHCQEYTYDPDIYFSGEEVSLALRGFTMGYDLFHPHRHILWHEYTRKHRPRHWDDHCEQSGLEPWHIRDARGQKRMRKLFGLEDNDADISGFGLGSARTLQQFEHYAGINFKRSLAHPYAKEGSPPPPTGSDGTGPLDQAFTAFIVEDEHGKVLFRHDCSALRRPAKLVTWKSDGTEWGERRDFDL